MIQFCIPGVQIALSNMDQLLLSGLVKASSDPEGQDHFQEFFALLPSNEIDSDFWRKRVVEFARNQLFFERECEAVLKTSLIFFRELAKVTVSDRNQQVKFQKNALINLFVLYFDEAETVSKELQLLQVFAGALQLTRIEIQEALANLLKRKYKLDISKCVSWLLHAEVPEYYLPALVRIVPNDQSLGDFHDAWLKASQGISEENVRYMLNCGSSQSWLSLLFKKIFNNEKLMLELNGNDVAGILQKEVRAIEYFHKMVPSLSQNLKMYAFYLYCYSAFRLDEAEFEPCKQSLKVIRQFFSNHSFNYTVLNRGIAFLDKKYFRSEDQEVTSIAKLRFSYLLDVLRKQSLKTSISWLIQVLYALNPEAFTVEQRLKLLQLLHKRWIKQESYYSFKEADHCLLLLSDEKPLFQDWISPIHFKEWLGRISCYNKNDFNWENFEEFMARLSQIAFRLNSEEILINAKSHLVALIDQYLRQNVLQLVNGNKLKTSVLKRNFALLCKSNLLKVIDEQRSYLTRKRNSSIRFEQ